MDQAQEIAPMRQAYRTLSQDEQDRVRAIKDAGAVLWLLCEAEPASREASLAKTKAEEAVMWAVKAITG